MKNTMTGSVALQGTSNEGHLVKVEFFEGFVDDDGERLRDDLYRCTVFNIGALHCSYATNDVEALEWFLNAVDHKAKNML